MPLTAEKQTFVQTVRRLYEGRLKSQLEPQHNGELIAVEQRTVRLVELADW
jgi:hypothetical protein